METILLFYQYVHIDNPHAIMQWQREICTKLGLNGRIILAHEGINGTLGGSPEATATYKELMLKHPLFSNIDFKESAGNKEDFPRLRIVVKDEIVRLGVDTKKITAADGGKHLTPQQAHELMTQKPQNLVILDGRNYYEARIGTFVNAITPKVNTFREFPEYLENNKELFKDKEVLMFCTGGIRCERASALLKSHGVAKEVYQIEGGIHRYAEQFPDGFFRGKNYIFDGRIAAKINDDILTNCDTCPAPYDEYTNCINALCNKQIISCPSCIKELGNTCSTQCNELVQTGAVVVRKIPKRSALQTETH